MNTLTEYLVWLGSIPRHVAKLLTDEATLLGMTVGALCLLVVAFASGDITEVTWLRVLGAFLSGNALLFAAWRSYIVLSRKDEWKQ